MQRNESMAPASSPRRAADAPAPVAPAAAGAAPTAGANAPPIFHRASPPETPRAASPPAAPRAASPMPEVPPMPKALSRQQQPGPRDEAPPPTTPRAASPRSPRASAKTPADPWSPPPPPRPHDWSPLFRALCENSTEQVRAALRDDPGAASVPLFDRGMDPPLCAAVRLGCHEEIVGVLLEHGAGACCVDLKGCEPLHLLSMSRSPYPLHHHMWAAWQALETGYELRVAAMLLEMGADPLSTKVKGGADTSSLSIAERMGKMHLVNLYRSNGVFGAPNTL